MKRRLPALLLSLVMLPALAQPIELPDLGDVASSALSAADERTLGERIIQQIRWRDAAYMDDAEVEAYIARLGTRLVAASEQPHGAFEFFVIRDPSINAFALPGGYIGLHSGLIMAAESESELASVVGHEIAHVTQRHIAQLFGKQGQTSMIMLASLLVAALAANSNSQISEAALFAGQAGAVQSQLSYTRAFEREADRIGLQVLEGAGFDVRGMPGFFERLQRLSRVYENNAPSYLRTHPLTQERISDMSNRVQQMRYRQVPDSDDFRFVRAKLKVGEGLASDAIRHFEAALADSPDDPFARYGLARAHLRAGQLERASAELARLNDAGVRSPFVAWLAAEVALARRQPAEAVVLVERALATHPDHQVLEYLLGDALLQAGEAERAVQLARSGTLRNQQDVRFWMLAARAEAQLGRRTAHHRAQAEVYVIRGSLPAAIEQLELARKAADGDFFEMSAVDARMRQLKEQDMRERASRR